MAKRNKKTGNNNRNPFTKPNFNEGIRNDGKTKSFKIENINEYMSANAQVNKVNYHSFKESKPKTQELGEQDFLESITDVAKTAPSYNATPEVEPSENENVDFDDILTRPTSDIFKLSKDYERAIPNWNPVDDYNEYSVTQTETNDLSGEESPFSNPSPRTRIPSYNESGSLRYQNPDMESQSASAKDDSLPLPSNAPRFRAPSSKDANAVPIRAVRREEQIQKNDSEPSFPSYLARASQHISDQDSVEETIPTAYHVSAGRHRRQEQVSQATSHSQESGTRRRRGGINQAPAQPQRAVPPQTPSPLDFQGETRTFNAPSSVHSRSQNRNNPFARPIENEDSIMARLSGESISNIPPIQRQESNKNRKPFSIIRVLIIFVLLLVLLLSTVVAIFFLVPSSDTGILGDIRRQIASFLPMSKEVEVENFSANSDTSGMVGDRFTFSLTTKNNVKNVRLVDADNIVLDTTAYTTTNDEITIWTIDYVATSTYKGAIRPQLLNIDDEWIDTEFTIPLNISLPPTEVPLETTPEPSEEEEMLDEEDLVENEDEESGTVMSSNQFQREPIPTAVPTLTPEPSASPTPSPSPSPEPTLEPTPEPTATPEPTPTPVPTPTPFYVGEAEPVKGLSAAEMKITDTAYSNGKSVSSYTRSTEIAFPDDANYQLWEDGIFTWRGNAYHQNASVGSPKDGIHNEKLTKAWEFPVGSLKLKTETVHGFGYMSQPAIIKWYKEAREFMNFKEAKKDVKGLTEVIFAAQDGNIYFLDINDGQETRDTLKLGVPMKSAVSVYPHTIPLFGVGQSASFLSNKQVDIGYRLFSLVDLKRLQFIDGRDSSAYFSNGAFDGTAIFDRENDTMVVAGENGMLYSVYLNSTFSYTEKALAISPTVDKHKSLARGQNKKLVGKEATVSALGKYLYVADNSGLIQCIDINTLKTAWAKQLEDNVDATIAIDTSSTGEAYIYVANTIQNKLKTTSIKVMKLDALSGETSWSKSFTVEPNKTTIIGALASPVIGKNVLEDYVIFTIADSKDSSYTIALSKENGNQHWKTRLSKYSVSSPIAIYDADKAWIVQGDSAGKLYLLDGVTGEQKDVLQLEGAIDASPAAYKGNIIVGTSGKKSYIYCITID